MVLCRYSKLNNLFIVVFLSAVAVGQSGSVCYQGTDIDQGEPLHFLIQIPCDQVPHVVPKNENDFSVLPEVGQGHAIKSCSHQVRCDDLQPYGMIGWSGRAPTWRDVLPGCWKPEQPEFVTVIGVGMTCEEERVDAERRKNEWRVLPEPKVKTHWWNRHPKATIISLAAAGVISGGIYGKVSAVNCTEYKNGASGANAHCLKEAK